MNWLRLIPLIGWIPDIVEMRRRANDQLHEREMRKLHVESMRIELELRSRDSDRMRRDGAAQGE